MMPGSVPSPPAQFRDNELFIRGICQTQAVTSSDLLISNETATRSEGTAPGLDRLPQPLFLRLVLRATIVLAEKTGHRITSAAQKSSKEARAAHRDDNKWQQAAEEFNE
ncbi:hypothetical protein V5799_014494 [Amblyomma americanum]|uniref:Uncharacterized protein n=1 Tax=Amblyomma americanum TaxID=6943 RepID=A0AAQ4E2V6_AMBAM